MSFHTLSALLVLLLFSASFSQAQEKLSQSGSRPFPIQGIVKQEGRDFPDYPLLELPDSYLNKQLPVVVDNSVYPYMRPIFQQQGASCGQAAGIAYNFCYEINRARNLPSNVATNQYPTHFAWNFMNAGTYYGVGVSYFHSFEILRTLGCPNEATFGPITMDNPYYWMSGYDKYYSAMHNRISNVHSIHLGNTRGLLTLKNWLNDHLEGSAVGGLANIYIGYSTSYVLPPDSPEAGKNIVINWQPEATHAMTIVGYHDSIRYDVNNDGQYTNNIDITSDGIIDMRDWEIGGVKLANSYGEIYADSGYCYALYSSLALKYGSGGIWNNSAHVLSVEPEYSSLLTLKTTIRHNKRGQIRLRVGVSEDTLANNPTVIMEFPVFNFQGGEMNMQGGYGPGDRDLELGLDITPLAGCLKEGRYGRFFLLLDEDDPAGIGTGAILQFSVISYFNGNTIEFSNNETPFPITENGTTQLSVAWSQPLPELKITPEFLPQTGTGTSLNVQFSATGATEPLSWKLKTDYTRVSEPATFEPGGGNKLPVTQAEEGVSMLILPFSFPFYGKTYDTLLIHFDGYLLFELFNAPYPYLQDEALYLSQIKAIAGFMNMSQQIALQTHGIWVDLEAHKATVTWILGGTTSASAASNQFKIVLHEDGRIEQFFGSIDAGIQGPGISGISNGDGINFQVLAWNESLPAGKTVFMPQKLPDSLQLSESGLLTSGISEGDYSADFTLLLTDGRHIKKEKKYTVTNGPDLSLSINSGGDEMIETGEKAVVALSLANHGPSALNNISCILRSLSPVLVMTDSVLLVSTLGQDNILIMNDAFRFQASDTVSGNIATALLLIMEWEGHRIEKLFACTLNKPEYSISSPLIIDQQNNFPDPGETCNLLLRLSYGGKQPAAHFTASLSTNDPFVTVYPPPYVFFEKQLFRSYDQAQWKLKIHPGTPKGHVVPMLLDASSDQGEQLQKSFSITIGETGILVIDLDKNHNSALHINAAIRNLGLQTITQPNIDSNIFRFDQAFVCLGIKPHMYLLNAAENDILDHYLQQGGNMYLESGVIFGTSIHFSAIDKFRVSGSTQAWTKRPDTIVGNTATVMEGLEFDYKGDSLMIYNLIPESPAIALFHDKTTSYDFVVANDSIQFKTIASSIEFGGFFPFSGNIREPVMHEYLRFLEIDPSPLAARMVASNYSPCTQESIVFTPVNSGEPTTYQWHFEGGNPEESDQESPECTWSAPGYYNVSLTVSDGYGSSALLLESLIHVLNCNDIQDKSPVNPYTLYPNPASSRLNIRNEAGIYMPLEISISDLSGKKCFTGKSFPVSMNEQTLDISSLAPGVYLVSLKDIIGQRTAKLIKL